MSGKSYIIKNTGDEPIVVTPGSNIESVELPAGEVFKCTYKGKTTYHDPKVKALLHASRKVVNNSMPYIAGAITLECEYYQKLKKALEDLEG